MMRRERLAMTVIIALGTLALVSIVSCASMMHCGQKCPEGLLNVAFAAVGALGGALAIRWEERSDDDGKKP